MPSQFTVPSPGPSLSSGVVANVLSQLLAAGTWLVWGQVNFAAAAATISQFACGLSLLSATLPAQAGGGGMGPEPLVIGPAALTLLTDTASLQCGPTLLTLTAAATLYLCARATFTLGACTAYGTLAALPILGLGHNLVCS